MDTGNGYHQNALQPGSGDRRGRYNNLFALGKGKIGQRHRGRGTVPGRGQLARTALRIDPAAAPWYVQAGDRPHQATRTTALPMAPMAPNVVPVDVEHQKKNGLERQKTPPATPKGKDKLYSEPPNTPTSADPQGSEEEDENEDRTDHSGKAVCKTPVERVVRPGGRQATPSNKDGGIADGTHGTKRGAS